MTSPTAGEIAAGLGPSAREVLLGTIRNEDWVAGEPELVESGCFVWEVNRWGQRYTTITDLGKQVAQELQKLG